MLKHLFLLFFSFTICPLPGITQTYEWQDEEFLYDLGENAPASIMKLVTSNLSGREKKQMCEEVRYFPVLSVELHMRDALIEQCKVISIYPYKHTAAIIERRLSGRETKHPSTQGANYYRIEMQSFCGLK